MNRSVIWVAFVLVAAVKIPISAEGLETLLRVANPSPEETPTLSVRTQSLSDGREQVFVTAFFPTIADATCDLWCYESAGLPFDHAEVGSEGSVVLVHNWTDRGADVRTTVTPSPGAIDLVARIDGSPTGGNPVDPPLNVCWQLHSSPGFASQPGVYPDFVKRCFIFTETGRVFLDQTTRRPILVRPADHEYNNPPWVQMYVPKSAGDVQSGSQSWASFSPDRYIVPLIGAVSRDGTAMMAIGAGVECTLSQAWHDCMHAHTKWVEAKEGSGKEWRIRVYAMPNDPDTLLARYREDFPQITVWE